MASPRCLDLARRPQCCTCSTFPNKPRSNLQFMDSDYSFRHINMVAAEKVFPLLSLIARIN